MRQFSQAYSSPEVLSPAVREIASADDLFVLCTEKRRTIVEYALYTATKPIGAATYRMLKSLPRELEGHLAGSETPARLLEAAE
jgi:hypothetical protein